MFALLGWSIAGWGLATVLWLGCTRLDYVLARVGHAGAGGYAGMQAFGLFFKLIAILVILFAALAADQTSRSTPH